MAEYSVLFIAADDLAFTLYKFQRINFNVLLDNL